MITPQFRIILWPRMAKNEEFPVKCCIAFQGKRRYYNTGITTNKKDWESSNARLLNKSRAKDNEVLNSLSVRAEKILRDWQKDNIMFSFEQFEKQMFSNKSPKHPTISELLRASAADFDKQNKISSSQTRLTIARLIDRFLPNATPATITADHLQHLIKLMQSAGLKQNTTSTYLSIVVAELRPYFKRGITSIEVLEAGKVAAGKPPKHAISRDEMRQFETYTPKSKIRQFHLDLFIFCFYVRGINLADIARLTPDNLQGDKLSYTRKKTGAHLSVTLLPPALRILDKYLQQDAPYIFPILKPGMAERQRVYHIRTISSRINNTIRAIAADLGLPERSRRISFYTARHTYATTLKRAGVDLGVISELIGHADVSTTRIYLDSFEDDTLHQADQHLL
jgi:integrase